MQICIYIYISVIADLYIYIYINSFIKAIESTKGTAKQLRIFFLFFPPYNLGEGLLKLVGAFYQNTILK
jgi:hypothetical protein